MSAEIDALELRVEECEPGWHKQIWKPIKGVTWNVFRERSYHLGKPRIGLGLRISYDWATGWGRFYRRLDVEIGLGVWIHAWIKWDCRRMKVLP